MKSVDNLTDQDRGILILRLSQMAAVKNRLFVSDAKNVEYTHSDENGGVYRFEVTLQFSDRAIFDVECHYQVASNTLFDIYYNDVNLSEFEEDDSYLYDCIHTSIRNHFKTLREAS